MSASDDDPGSTDAGGPVGRGAHPSTPGPTAPDADAPGPAAPDAGVARAAAPDADAPGGAERGAGTRDVATPGATPAAAIAIVAAGLVAGALPMFLVAALAPRIDADLGIGTRGTGIVVAAFFLAAAVGSIPGGRTADRLGSRRALQLGLVITVLATTLAATLGQGIVSLVLTIGLAGFALSFLDPGGARTLAAAVTTDRHGMAFGVKEASIPMASLLAGASLPLIPSDFGWRLSFLGAAVLAAVVAVAVPRNLEQRPPRDSVAGLADSAHSAAEESGSTVQAGSVGLPASALIDDPRARRNGLLVLSLVAALGGGIAAGFSTYLVTSAVDGGFSPEAAGIVFAVSSLAAVVVRLVVGRVADAGQPGRELRLLRAAMLIGAVGIAINALGTPATAIVGGLIGLGAGWGWTGLVFLAAVRIDPKRPAAASGVVLAGLAIGGVIGPALFGLIAEAAGFSLVFTLAAAVMAIAGIVVSIPIRQIRTPKQPAR